MCSMPSTEPTFQNQILSLQKILVDIFMVSKEVTSWLQKSQSDPKSHIGQRVIDL